MFVKKGRPSFLCTVFIQNGTQRSQCSQLFELFLSSKFGPKQVGKDGSTTSGSTSFVCCIDSRTFNTISKQLVQKGVCIRFIFNGIPKHFGIFLRNGRSRKKRLPGYLQIHKIVLFRVGCQGFDICFEPGIECLLLIRSPQGVLGTLVFGSPLLQLASQLIDLLHICLGISATECRRCSITVLRTTTSTSTTPFVSPQIGKRFKQIINCNTSCSILRICRWRNTKAVLKVSLLLFCLTTNQCFWIQCLTCQDNILH
mmetsp:Transcript_11618/g.17033  ORF Transcript_11618/g.17033 Transcript_11618/m.17033 type:complete len:256 (+) Transcript_11618:556-1323(+)